MVSNIWYLIAYPIFFIHWAPTFPRSLTRSRPGTPWARPFRGPRAPRWRNAGAPCGAWCAKPAWRRYLGGGEGVGLGGGLGWVIWVVSGGKVAKKHYKKDNWIMFKVLNITTWAHYKKAELNVLWNRSHLLKWCVVHTVSLIWFPLRLAKVISHRDGQLEFSLELEAIHLGVGCCPKVPRGVSWEGAQQPRA